MLSTRPAAVHTTRVTCFPHPRRAALFSAAGLFVSLGGRVAPRARDAAAGGREHPGHRRELSEALSAFVCSRPPLYAATRVLRVRREGVTTPSEE